MYAKNTTHIYYSLTNKCRKHKIFDTNSNKYSKWATRKASNLTLIKKGRIYSSQKRFKKMYDNMYTCIKRYVEGV